MKKTDFDNKLTSFNKRITSNKTKYLDVQKKLNSLITKDYSYFIDRLYFTSNDGSQTTFVYQLRLDTSELKKKTKALIMFLFGNHKEYIILTVNHYILRSWIA